MEKVKTVYIIDDDPVYVYVTKKVMEIQGFAQQIVVFTDAKEAFDHLQQIVEKTNEDLPELIFLDINMPGWDGWNFLEEFSKIPPLKSISVYLVSSAADNIQERKHAARYQSVKELVEKPLTIARLKEIRWR